ncbi:MAG: oatA 2 [Gemmatimonadetes bacterium]|nr:oatA 2 [Gemmatimonadota bacterium]
MVMAFHFWKEAPTDPVHSAVSLVFTAGWAGVDLFFVLSGFLITGILVDARADPHYFRNFYVRRALRIFPLYYTALALRFWILPTLLPTQPALAFTRQQAAWALTYLNNVANVVPRGSTLDVQHFWSLAIEEQFYLAWPAVVLACSSERLRKVVVGLALVGVLSRVASELAFPGNLMAYFLTPMRVDALAMGAWIALEQRRTGGLARIRSHARTILFGCALALVIAAIPSRGRLLFDYPLVLTLGTLAFDVTAAMVVVIVLESGVNSSVVRWLDSSVPRKIGKHSYALYVIHWPLYLVARAQVHTERVPSIFGSRLPIQLAFDLGMLGATMLLALVSWHLIEQPFIRMKDRFTIVQNRRDGSAG